MISGIRRITIYSGNNEPLTIDSIHSLLVELLITALQKVF